MVEWNILQGERSLLMQFFIMQLRCVTMPLKDQSYTNK